MRRTFKTGSLVAAILFLAMAGNAQAQKSKDTLKVAFAEATQNADPYTDPKPENNFMGEALYDGLIAFDEHTLKFEPLLAESWRRVDPKTLEFKLRRDVKWSDGEKFTADDVVYTINWLANPKTRIRFRQNWAWIDKAEKVDDYTVRIIEKHPTTFDMVRLAYQTFIFPKHIHEPLKNKAEFGTRPVGTGMYKAVQVDRNKGAILLKNPDYRHGGTAKPASNIGRVEVKAIPDIGAQVAALLAGDVHIARGLSYDEAEGLAKDPRFTFTLAQSISYIYLYFDVAGRTGRKEFQDIRVREAMIRAINRNEVPTVRSGTRKLPRGNPEALCWRLQRGCGYSEPIPAYDPAKAKALLAEAGYADGFDVSLTAFNSVKDFAEVIAGDLRKVGIRASVNAVTFSAYRAQQRDGKIEVMANAWSAGAMPDVSSTMTFFFAPSPRDYLKMPALYKMAKAVNAEMDDTKRRALTRALLDKVTKERLIVPVSALPLPIVHISDVTVREGRIQPHGYFMSDLNWK